ncbi:MAG: DinB family protein [Bacteroidota bacterium]
MSKLEYWLRGPIPEIPILLQPIAHALLQVQEELEVVLENFPEASLWEKPSGVASVGFHLQHLVGVLDRLFTYAKNETLSKEQLEYLVNEGNENPNLSVKILLNAFAEQVEKSLQQLKTTDSAELADLRLVGRKLLQSTTLGLLFHAAEHTTRHFGQLLVTVRMLR